MISILSRSNQQIEYSTLIELTQLDRELIGLLKHLVSELDFTHWGYQIPQSCQICLKRGFGILFYPSQNVNGPLILVRGLFQPRSVIVILNSFLSYITGLLQYFALNINSIILYWIWNHVKLFRNSHNISTPQF